MRLYKGKRILIETGINSDFYTVGFFTIRREFTELNGHVQSYYLFILPMLYLAVHIGHKTEEYVVPKKQPRPKSHGR